MKDLIDRFLEGIRVLDPTEGSGAWTYYLDLLSLIEDHRDELRHAEWPTGFDPLEADTYRLFLVKIEDELRRLLIDVPLAAPEQQKWTLDVFRGFFDNFLARAKAVSERLGGAQLH